MASEPGSEAGRQQTDKVSRLPQIMANHPQLTCLVFALVLTALSQYAKGLSKPLVFPQPAPRRFFPSPTPVVDYPYGNIGDVGHLLAEQEVLFVMYYAPWCAQSKRIRAEFERAAIYLKDSVRFAAVNCWYPNGTCRKQNSFPSFPAFFFYHTELDSYKYLGLMKAEYMVQFIQRLLHPLTYLKSKDDVAMFIAERDNSVIGFFDFNSSPQPPGYEQYYYAALRTYAVDCINPVEFSIITDSSLAQQFELEGSGSIHLKRSLNTTLMYPLPEENMTASSIITWAHMYKQPLTVTWSLSSGAKSVQLSSLIGQSPALIVFIPNFPVNPSKHIFNILREISLDYHNCANSTKVNNLVHSLKYIRWLNAVEHRELAEHCQKTNNGKQVSPCDEERFSAIPTKRCCQSVLLETAPQNICDVCLNQLFTGSEGWNPCHSRPAVSQSPWWSYLQDTSSPSQHGACSELQPFYNAAEFLTICCEDSSFSNSDNSNSRTKHQYVKPTSKKRQSNDPYVIKSVQDRDLDYCDKLRAQRQFGWEGPAHSFPEPGDHTLKSGLSGLSCETNRSLAFIAMDARSSQPFIDRLGLKVKRRGREAVAVIFDQKAEAVHLLDNAVNKKTLVEFIQNYTSSSVAVHRRSTPPSAQYQDRSSLSDQGTKTHTTEPSPDQGGYNWERVSVLDVTADSFRRDVLESDKDVVLMYYAPWCGFCAGFSHIYLSLAKYFKSTKNIVFARVNAYTNDLPWEYTVDVYPTIMLFPARRPAESVTFPDHLRKNLPNLIYFVLHYGSEAGKVETGLSICSTGCIQNNIASSVHKIQTLNAVISDLETKLHRVDANLQKYTDSFMRDLLQMYKTQLKRKILSKRLTQNQARFVHRELVATSGVYIERHRLVRLLNKYRTYRQTYADVLKGIREEVEIVEFPVPDPTSTEALEDQLKVEHQVLNTEL